MDCVIELPRQIRAGLARIYELKQSGIDLDSAIARVTEELKLDAESVSHLPPHEFDAFVAKYAY